MSRPRPREIERQGDEVPTPMPHVRFTRRGEEIAEPLAPRLLTRRAAAAYLSVSIAMLDSLRLQGELTVVAMPSSRTGKVIRIPLFDRIQLDEAVARWTNTAGR